MASDKAYIEYVNSVIRRGELYIELERVRKYLIVAETNKCLNNQERRAHIIHLTRLFRGLLSAKEARQKAIHEVRDDNGSNAENRSASPTHDPRPSVSVGDVLEEKVARR